MHHLTNLELAVQHGQELRAAAARARVAAAARQARSWQFRFESIGDAILDHTGRS
jgi:hypothetical protein